MRRTFCDAQAWSRALSFSKTALCKNSWLNAVHVCQCRLTLAARNLWRPISRSGLEAYIAFRWDNSFRSWWFSFSHFSTSFSLSARCLSLSARCLSLSSRSLSLSSRSFCSACVIRAFFSAGHSVPSMRTLTTPFDMAERVGLEPGKKKRELHIAWETATRWHQFSCSLMNILNENLQRSGLGLAFACGLMGRLSWVCSRTLLHRHHSINMDLLGAWTFRLGCEG